MNPKYGYRTLGPLGIKPKPECTVHQARAGRCTEESPEAQIPDAGMNPGPLTVLAVSCHEPTEHKAKENEAKKATEYFPNGTDQLLSESYLLQPSPWLCVLIPTHP